MNYQIGQVIYVILNKEARVYPMLVCEIVTKKTIEGEVVTYMVKGGPSAETLVAMSEIDGEVFETPEHVKKSLISRASANINKRVDDAQAKAKEWYPTAITTMQPNDDIDSLPSKKKGSKRLQAVPSEPIIEDAEMIQLPDGTFAKVKSLKIPDALGS